MRKTGLLITLGMTLTMAVACQGRNQSTTTSSDTASNPPGGTKTTVDTAPASQPEASVQPNAGRPIDAWLGKWIGPEGTYLLLSRNGDKYVVKIQSLDGPATYQGVAHGDGIQFERQGTTESIHAGSGEQTGMKWLLEKKNCLIVKTGEGFCRD
jgi:hypothetical protein